MARTKSTAPEAPASNGETTVAPAPSVQPDPSRINARLRQIAEIGGNPDGSISRLGYSREEREAHALVSGWLKDLGLKVWQDDAGNTIAERPGSQTGAPALGTGSHLDSVPHGGRFDGIVGVVGAVEFIQQVVEQDVRTVHPLRVAIFAAEEGARFGEPCIGSKIVSGSLAERSFDAIRDTQGVSLAQAMAALGMDPARAARARWNPDEWGVFLELHVEQARVLETEGRQVGLVDVVSGSTRLRLLLQGRADHSGGTPMDLRADALTAAAEVALAAEAIARDPRHRGTRATVGRLDVHPNSITTIPGRVVLTVDIRDVDSDRQRLTAAEIAQRAHQIVERRGVHLDAEVIADTSPAVLPMWVRDITSSVCRDLGVNARIMTSGAGHDSQVINRIIPAGILFVPSRDGLSHVPEEWTSASDIARGVEVLYHSLLRLDTFLTQFAENADPGGTGATT